MTPKLSLVIMFLMFRIGILNASSQCQAGEHSIGGMFLRGHTFMTYRVGLPEMCYFRCEEEVTCQSYNFVIAQRICELNNRTKEATPEDFMPDQRRFYMKRSHNRVPLGSIKELPADTCGEIRASEGEEMIDGIHWIYSEENGEVIEAYCKEGWQKINVKGPVCFGAKDNEYGSFNMTKSGRVKTMKLIHRSGSVHCNPKAYCKEGWQKINGEVPVCFGAKDNDYGAFNMTKRGRVKTMKLIHRSGWVKCNPKYKASFWSCTNPQYKEHLMTIITDADKKPVLPPTENLTNLGMAGEKAHFYSLPGYHHNSTELVFRTLVNPLSVSNNQEMQIWYGQDMVDSREEGNSGKTCVDVYAFYV